jgi:Sec-independent protein translocase protein TatA
LGIVEIILFLIIALIVIPPEHLPEVMRTVGKILRELRLASNTVLREISGAIDEPPSYMRPLPPATPPPPAQAAPVQEPDAEIPTTETPAEGSATQPRS